MGVATPSRDEGVPLEEIAAVFGDQDEVRMFGEDIHVDHTTHELVVDKHGGAAAEAESRTGLHRS